MGIGEGLVAIAASLAIGISAIGTALAQTKIGTAVVGATAEDPGFLGKGILILAIPETIVVFGFAIAYLLLAKIG